MISICVHRPKLPDAAAIMPYLRAIDQNRWYSNWGPLVTALEARLAGHFRLGDETVVTVVNGTIGLTLALMALDAEPGTLCIMPSWTFTATAMAAIAAGLVPYFVDVDPESWAITPDIVHDAIATAPGRVGAVIPVIPFGCPSNGDVWDAFAESTGIPTVIDAAAAFDSWKPTRQPAMISLHATKILGVGEGGMVISTDPRILRKVRTCANFGFDGDRDSRMVAINGKMSEYHAAVGLAALDAYLSTRKAYCDVASAYAEGFRGLYSLFPQPGFGATWIASTMMVTLQDRPAEAFADALWTRGVDTRRWWGRGLHHHRALKNYPSTGLPTTDWLADHTIGLPMSSDLTFEETERVLDAVHSFYRDDSALIQATG
jgi:dTDP-4-amino-4,6-dideoxygalactose transaminase